MRGSLMVSECVMGRLCEKAVFNQEQQSCLNRYSGEDFLVAERRYQFHMLNERLGC